MVRDVSDPRVYGHWWDEVSDDSWDLYCSGTDDPNAIVHGYKIVKAPKRGTPYAEYWPTTEEAKHIVDALNAYDRKPPTPSRAYRILDFLSTAGGSILRTKPRRG